MTSSPMTACPECHSIGAHFYECPQANVGLALGKRRVRDARDKERWTRNKKKAIARDVTCRWEGCNADRGLHPHHIETVQECEARGLPWSEIDRVGNIATLCHPHHDEAHSAAGIEEAIRQEMRIAPKNHQPESPS